MLSDSFPRLTARGTRTHFSFNYRNQHQAPDLSHPPSQTDPSSSSEDDTSIHADVLSVLVATSDKSTATHSNTASTSTHGNASLIGSSIDGDASFAAADVVAAADVLSVLRTASDKSTSTQSKEASTSSYGDDVLFAADVLSVLHSTSNKSTTGSLGNESLVGSSMDDKEIQCLLHTMSEQHVSGLCTSPSAASLTFVNLLLNETSEAPPTRSPIGMEIDLTTNDL